MRKPPKTSNAITLPSHATRTTTAGLESVQIKPASCFVFWWDAGNTIRSLPDFIFVIVWKQWTIKDNGAAALCLSLSSCIGLGGADERRPSFICEGLSAVVKPRVAGTSSKYTGISIEVWQIGALEKRYHYFCLEADRSAVFHYH